MTDSVREDRAVFYRQAGLFAHTGVMPAPGVNVSAGHAHVFFGLNQVLTCLVYCNLAARRFACRMEVPIFQLFNRARNRASRAIAGTGAGSAASGQPAGQQRSVLTHIGSRQYRLTSDDNYLDHVQGEFEPHMVRLFAALVRPGDCVLDVGANIGCTSLLFSQLARQVYSFEPSPSTFRLLHKNLDDAGVSNVVAANLGLGRSEGAFELTFAPDNRSGGFVSNLTSASAGHVVEKIRIVAGDAYLNDAHIDQVDFIKIDVEGFERNVIDGLAGTIQRCRPVVVLELNHWCLNAFQRTSVPDFFDFLRGVFPCLYAVDGAEVRNLHDMDDAYYVMYQHIVHNFRFANLVAAFDPARVRLDGLGNS
jgi:FkbM family methyltransferase